MVALISSKLFWFSFGIGNSCFIIKNRFHKGNFRNLFRWKSIECCSLTQLKLLELFDENFSTFLFQIHLFSFCWLQFLSNLNAKFEILFAAILNCMHMMERWENFLRTFSKPSKPICAFNICICILIECKVCVFTHWTTNHVW